MPTPGERQALLFVTAVAALGIGVRSCRALRPDSAEAGASESLAVQIAQVDSAISSGGRRRSRPAGSSPAASAATSSASPGPRRADREGRPREPEPAPTAPVDIDLATVEELDRLPGIGPALAARIVEDREARGPFGSLDALQQVRGIGPVLAERLRAHVTFSQPPRPPLTEAPAPRRGRRP